MISPIRVRLDTRADFQVAELIPLGGLTVLASAPGAGATTLVTNLMVATVSEGGRFLDRDTRQGAAACLTSQGDNERTRTLDRIYQGHVNRSLERGMRLGECFFATKEVGTGWKVSEIEAYIEDTRRNVEAWEKGLRLVVIDDISDVPDSEVPNFCAALNRLAAKHNVAVVAVDRLPHETRQRRRHQARLDVLQQVTALLILERLAAEVPGGSLRLRVTVQKMSRARDGYALFADVHHSVTGDNQPLICVSVGSPVVQDAAPATKLGRAVEAVRATLLAQTGEPVSHAHLLAVAGAEGVSERTAGTAVREAVHALGTAVTVQKLPAPGSPQVYTLQPDVDEGPEPLTEAPEPLPEVLDPLPEVLEPLLEVPDLLPEASELLPEALDPLPLPEVPEPLPEAPEPIS